MINVYKITACYLFQASERWSQIEIFYINLSTNLQLLTGLTLQILFSSV